MIKKNLLLRALALLLAIICCLGLFACGPKTPPEPTPDENGGETGNGGSSGGDGTGDGILQEGGDFSASDKNWDEWLYKDGKAFGDGQKTVTVRVVKGGKSFSFTVKSNEASLEAALLGSGFFKSGDIVAGEPYRVNGMRVNTGAAWVITKGTDPAPISLQAALANGDVFTITYTLVS